MMVVRAVAGGRRDMYIVYIWWKERDKERWLPQPRPFLSMRASVNHRVKRTKDSNSSLTVSALLHLRPNVHQFWRLSYYNRPGIRGPQDCPGGGRCVEVMCGGKECSFCVGKLFSKKHSKIFSPCPLFGSAVLSVVRLLKASRPSEGLNLSATIVTAARR